MTIGGVLAQVVSWTRQAKIAFVSLRARGGQGEQGSCAAGKQGRRHPPCRLCRGLACPPSRSPGLHQVTSRAMLGQLQRCFPMLVPLFPTRVASSSASRPSASSLAVKALCSALRIVCALSASSSMRSASVQSSVKCDVLLVHRFELEESSKHVCELRSRYGLQEGCNTDEQKILCTITLVSIVAHLTQGFLLRGALTVSNSPGNQLSTPLLSAITPTNEARLRSISRTTRSSLGDADHLTVDSTPCRHPRCWTAGARLATTAS